MAQNQAALESAAVPRLDLPAPQADRSGISDAAERAVTADVVLFDTTCVLCSGAARFIIRRDPRGLLRFAGLSSAAADALLAAAGVSGPLPDSMVLIETDGVDPRSPGARPRVYMRSDAALKIAGRLSFPWRLLTALRAVPRPIRDWMYEATARRRYRWFGRRDACEAPTPEVRRRMLG